MHMRVARRGPWRYVVFPISRVFRCPDASQASLRRGSSLEETETPKCCTLPGCVTGVVTTRVEVGAEWHTNRICERKAPRGSNQPRECNGALDGGLD